MIEIIKPGNIRACRRALELSQAVCAEKISVSSTTFKDYEKKGELWVSQIVQLTEFFKKEAEIKKVDISYF